MIIFKKVIDQNTGVGIPYASVELIDGNGTFLGAGTSADVSGNFALDSLMMKEGTFLKITSSGYKSSAFSYDQYSIDQDAAFALMPDIVELPTVVVTAIKKGIADNKNLIYLGLGITALYLIMRKK